MNRGVIYIILVSLFCNFKSYTQTQNADTVCVNHSSFYWVNGSFQSTFQWSLSGGSIINGQGNDTVFIKWGNVPGDYKLNVVETNIYGCNGDTIYLNVHIIDNQPTQIIGPNEICFGDSVWLYGINSSYYFWGNGQTYDSILIYPHVSTTYYLIGQDYCGYDTTTHFIQVHPLPIPNFEFEPSNPQYADNIKFSYTGSPVIAWYWFDNLSLFSNQQNPIYQIFDIQNIKLFVEDQYGCTNSITKEIVIGNHINIYIPNAFSPNNDGTNDIFRAETSYNPECYQMLIYNRWGELVFETKDINYGWDGKYLNKDVPQGVYNWIIRYCSNKNNGLYQNFGQVILIR